MHLSVYRQCEISYYAFVFGLIMGVYYDFYRFLRFLGFKSKCAIIAQDLLFMSSLSVLCVLFSQLTVNGKLRLFVLLFHFFGLLSYRYSVGIITGKIYKFFADIIIRLISCVSKKLSNYYRKIKIPFVCISSSFIKAFRVFVLLCCKKVKFKKIQKISNNLKIVLAKKV